MRIHLAVLVLASIASSVSWAVDYRVEPLDEPPPSDALPAEIAATLQTKGLRVIRGTETTFCDLWLTKTWDVKADFEPTPAVQYPFTPGQLIGVVRFARKAADFRDQDVDSGVYTLRYGQQPVDGAHVGTSPTRDFLLVLKADADQTPAIPDFKQLTAQSAEAAGSSHPALFSLQRLAEEKAARPSMRHNEEHDWWIVGFQGTTAGGQPLAAELVIAGVAAE